MKRMLLLLGSVCVAHSTKTLIALYTIGIAWLDRLVPVTGPMLQEEALIIASSLGINEFKASNGWLQRFKDRNNIKQLVVSGESGDVRRLLLLGETCNTYTRLFPREYMEQG